MEWSRPVDLYCERLDPSFWAEPLNAISNASFIIAAALALYEWQNRGKDGARDWPVAALIAVTFCIGIGSFIFHTVATRGAALFDTIPIAVFIYGYLLLAVHRFLGLRLVMALLVVAGFFAFSFVEGMLVPRGALNGSHAYLPAFGALIVVGWLTPDRAPSRLLLAAAGVFAVSILFRTVDQNACDALPIGTHYLWHLLNGVVLYLCLRAAQAATPR